MVIVKGTLRGMGHEVECGLIATMDDAQRSSLALYSQCTIIDAPRDLPDGYYEVDFCGQSAFLRRVGGQWGIGKPWRTDELPVANVA